jgi:hypothetical protein
MKTFPHHHLRIKMVKKRAQRRKRKFFTIFRGHRGLILSCNHLTIMRFKAVPIFTFRAIINQGVHKEE